MAAKKSIGVTGLTKKFEKLDIFSEIKRYNDSRRKSTTSPAQSKAGKLQSNQKPKVAAAGYHERQRRGQLADTYNEGVVKNSGAQNPHGKFFVNTD